MFSRVAAVPGSTAYGGVFPVGCAEATDFTMEYSEQVAAFVKAEV